MNKRVIILGSGGYIGSWLLKRFLSEKNCEVVGLSSRECDLLSLSSVTSALSDLNRNDVVIVTAAITRLKENTYNSLVKNVQMAENLGVVMAKRLAGQVIYLSSIDVYGSLEKNFKAKDIALTESSELNPDDYYGISKAAGEMLLKKCAGETDTPLTILRLPGVYGPGDNNAGTIFKLMSQIAERGKVEIYGDGQDRRYYLYIDDLYRVIAEAIQERSNTVLNIVNDENVSILEIVEYIQSAVKRKCELIFRPVAESGRERIRHMTIDNTKLHKVLPQVILTELPQGISLYSEYLACHKS